jgi:radical SAM protein with 4Fe4S-binding SPASM domain
MALFRDVAIYVVESIVRAWSIAKLKALLFWSYLHGYRVEGFQRIRIEVASVCNLRCVYCPTGTSYHYPGVYRGIMDLDMFLKVVEQIREVKTLHTAYLYLGGEPLLNKNLAIMCRALKEATYITDLSFITNAMLITEDFCKSLEGSGVDRITVSIDGRSPEENDRYRVGAKYEKIRDNVLMLKKYADMYGIKIIIGNIIIPNKDELDRKPETPEYLKRDFPGIHVATYYANTWPGLKDEYIEKEGLKVYTPFLHYLCYNPFYEVDVRVNGDVVMCCNDLLSEYVMGNIKDNTLMEIFNNDKYREVRKNMIERDIDNIPEVCKKCPTLMCGYLYREPTSDDLCEPSP